MTFILMEGSLRLELEVLPVGSLVQHEETVPEILDRLALELKNWANLQNPVIVEENNIVLDGNHRAGIFRRLHYNYIPVCRIDYFNDGVKLKYWYRRVSGFRDEVGLEELISDLGFSIRVVMDAGELRSHLVGHPFALGLQVGSRFSFVDAGVGGVRDAVDAYRIVRKIEEWLFSRGSKYEYIPCQYLDDSRFISGLAGDDLIIWTPHITKQMVVDVARSGRVFPPKSTRHL
ncbi:MAG: hypothetical protein ACTSRA_22545, partial [Promethearchaeota archaeon]